MVRLSMILTLTAKPVIKLDLGLRFTGLTLYLPNLHKGQLDSPFVKSLLFLYSLYFYFYNNNISIVL